MLNDQSTEDNKHQDNQNNKWIHNLWEIGQIAAFIFSAQVGSGFFILPSLLSGGGYLSFVVLAIVGILAMITIHIFAQTGMGIRSLIEKSFGTTISKYIYFVYWFISWFSTIVLFKELVGYCGLVGHRANMVELLIWIFVTGFNLWHIKHTVYLESGLTVIKFLPFALLIIGYIISPSNNTTVIENLDKVSISLFLRCMWCFVGVETGNIVAGNLRIAPQNKKIGTYVGMFVVVVFYCVSILLSFVLVGNKILVNNMSPYLTILQFAYSKFLSSNTIAHILQILIVLTLIGSINSWTISSGYTAKECGEHGILPSFFGVKNRNGVPYVGILASSICVLVFLFICNSSNIYKMIVNAIDISCCFFLLIYGICLLAYGKSYVKTIYSKVFYLLISTVFIAAFAIEMYKYIKI